MADSGNRRIQHFDCSSGTPVFVRAFGSSAVFNSPGDVDIDAGGFVYVTDLPAHRVHKLNPAGVWLKSWGEEGTEPGQFTGPFDVVVDGAQLHVSDSLNGRIQTFDLNGVFQLAWPSSFVPSPTRMTLTPERVLYVSAPLAWRVFLYQLDPVSTQSWSDVKGAFR